MRGGQRKKKGSVEKDEVDRLLEAAQDEVMLNLSVDSHISAVSSDYLDPDLRRRFNALRSRPSAAPPTENNQRRRRSEEQQMPRSEDVGEPQGDLMARFAALKASLPASSSSSSVPAIPRDGDRKEEEEEDEVEKVIKWAMDAARLDPSLESDDDDDHTHRSNGDDDHHDEDVGTKKDGKR